VPKFVRPYFGLYLDPASAGFISACSWVVINAQHLSFSSTPWQAAQYYNSDSFNPYMTQLEKLLIAAPNI